MLTPILLAVLLTVGSPCHGFDGRVNSLVPAVGAWFGVETNWDTDIASYLNNLTYAGAEPVSYSYDITIPFQSASDITNVENFLSFIAPRRPMVMLTVEPSQGLDAVTSASIAKLVTMLSHWEKKGIVFIVRFAPEMNGSW